MNRTSSNPLAGPVMVTENGTQVTFSGPKNWDSSLSTIFFSPLSRFCRVRLTAAGTRGGKNRFHSDGKRWLPPVWKVCQLVPGRWLSTFFSRKSSTFPIKLRFTLQLERGNHQADSLKTYPSQANPVAKVPHSDRYFHFLRLKPWTRGRFRAGATAVAASRNSTCVPL